jgi:polar amino acid transport system substrate-binding protein
LKRRFVLSTVLLALLLAFLPLVSGCGAVTGRQTTATLGEANADAIAADAAIAAVTPSEDIETPTTIEAGVLRAGCDVAFPPLAYLAVVEKVEGEKTLKETKIVGFEIDLCTAIAKKMGLTLEVVPADWDDVVPALLNDRVDMIMSAMIITPELEQELSFTDPYLACVLAISTPLDAPVADSAGLVGKTVGVQLDTLSYSRVMTIAGVAEIKTYSTIIEAFADLAGGHVQAVVNDEIASAYVLENDPDLKAKLVNSGTITTDTGYGYATRKGNASLLTALNAALAELRADGVYQKICAKWGVSGN